MIRNQKKKVVDVQKCETTSSSHSGLLEGKGKVNRCFIPDKRSNHMKVVRLELGLIPRTDKCWNKKSKSESS